MNIDISDKKIEEMMQTEMRRIISQRITNSINDGKAYWFSQQNIESITRQCVNDRIENTYILNAIDALDKATLVESISKSVAKHVADFLQ